MIKIGFIYLLLTLSIYSHQSIGGVSKSYKEEYDPGRQEQFTKYRKAKKGKLTLENTKILIEVLNSDYDWIYYEDGYATPPPSFLAGGRLTLIFPEFGLRKTGLHPRGKGLQKLKKWFELNCDKFDFNEDGTHYWKEPPVTLAQIEKEFFPEEKKKRRDLITGVIVEKFYHLKTI